ncbi:MAG: hypothetical protein KGL39_57220 [Patescibacteria group bacterium]|nr:hypothetical protein [Patescibacteria group bacterium]
MEKTFSRFINRLDRQLTGFQADDNAALLRDICTNSATGHVRQLRPNGAVNVPNHAAEQVEAHLVKLGWTRA